jgi:ferredoxin
MVDGNYFEMSQKQTILDAALKQGIDAPFLSGRNMQQLLPLE